MIGHQAGLNRLKLTKSTRYLVVMSLFTQVHLQLVYCFVQLFLKLSKDHLSFKGVDGL